MHNDRRAAPAVKGREGCQLLAQKRFCRLLHNGRPSVLIEPRFTDGKPMHIAALLAAAEAPLDAPVGDAVVVAPQLGGLLR